MSNDFTDFAEDVADLAEDLANDVDTANKGATEEVSDGVESHLKANDTPATGNITDELKARERPTDASEGLVSSREVSTDDVYKYIEYGTGTHGPYKAPSPAPPFEKMVEWLAAKGYTENIFIRAQGLQEHIGRYGNRAHPFMRPIWYGGGEDIVIGSVAMAMKTSVKRM